MIRNVLQTMAVRGVNHVYGDGEWVDVINRHLPGGDVIDAQEDLIECGLEEVARV